MTLITNAWLEDRGGLHDARILDAHHRRSRIEIAIDDALANENDGTSDGTAGLIVVFDAAVIEGDVPSIVGGWISQVEHIDENIVLDFCDRSRLVIRGTAVWKDGVI